MTPQYVEARLHANRPILPPIDEERLLCACGDDPSLARQLLREMQSAVITQTEQIVEYASTEQSEIAAEAAHSLKGAASILGAEPLHLAARGIESAMDGQNEADLRDAVNQLCDAAQAFIDAVPTVADSLSAPKFNYTI